MSTHCSIIAWEISRTEEPSGLLSMRLQRFIHDLVTDKAKKEKRKSISEPSGKRVIFKEREGEIS